MTDKSGNKRVSFRIVEMDCASCSRIIKKALHDKDGVLDVKINVMTDCAYVQYDPSKIAEEEIEEAIKKIGYMPLRLSRIG